MGPFVGVFLRVDDAGVFDFVTEPGLVAGGVVTGEVFEVIRVGRGDGDGDLRLDALVVTVATSGVDDFEEDNGELSIGVTGDFLFEGGTIFGIAPERKVWMEIRTGVGISSALGVVDVVALGLFFSTLLGATEVAIGLLIEFTLLAFNAPNNCK
jgi:hypothetical protein